MFKRDYVIKGKHATYAKYLSKSTEQNSKEKVAGVFSSIIEIYKIAPLIGVAYDLKADVDTEAKDSVRIFAEAMVNHQDDLFFLYRLILLADDSSKLSNDQKIDRAFKNQEVEESQEEGLELYHKYLRGGIEWLYKYITENATIQEDYIRNLKDIVVMYQQDFLE